MSLANVVEYHNATAKYFNLPEWSTTDINQVMADEMFSQIDNNLSPENLFADGERPRNRAMALKKRYLKAIEELKAKGFRPSRQMYNV